MIGKINLVKIMGTTDKYLKETLETEFRIRGELLIKFYSDSFDFDEAFDSYSVTGWEESRKAYFSALSLGFFENEQEMTPKKFINELKGFEKFIFSKVYAGGLSKKLYRLFEYKKA